MDKHTQQKMVKFEQVEVKDVDEENKREETKDGEKKTLIRIKMKKYLQWKREKTDFEKKYDFLFKGKETNTINQAIYQSIVQLRKMIIVIIISCFENRAYYQLQMLSKMSLFMICYVASSRPFIDPRQNQIELMNEATIMILTYIYMFFSQSYEANLTMGTLFIAVFMSNIVINILFVFSDIIFNSIPKLKKWIVPMYDKYSHFYKIKKWVRNKEEDAKNKKVGDKQYAYHIEA